MTPRISSEKNTRVLFVTPANIDIGGDANCIFIAPAFDNKEQSASDVRVTIRARIDGVSIEMEGLIGFYEENKLGRNGRARLSEIVRSKNEKITYAREYPYFTMLADLDEYRKLVSELGPEKAQETLLACRDLAAWRHFRPTAAWIAAALTHRIFTISFLSNSETYFALHNAGEILTGLQNERTARPSRSLILKQSSQKEGDDIHFNFDHSSQLPKRISVLIGKNGVGKTRALGRLTRSLLGRKKYFYEETSGDLPVVSRLLVFAPNAEGEAAFPAQTKSTKSWYRRFSLNRKHRPQHGERVTELITQLVRLRSLIARTTRWQIFIDAIAPITNIGQIVLSTHNPQSPHLKLVNLPTGTGMSALEDLASIDPRKDPMRLVEGKAYPLSSGELSFLRFAAQASLFIENGSLVVLDEPETHLHPNFISAFVLLLDELLRRTGSSAILSTHSVYFVREVCREQVVILSIDDNSIARAQHPRLATLGANVGAVSDFVFGEDNASQLMSKLERQIQQQGLSWDDVYREFKDEMSLELLSSLREKLEAREPSE